MMTYEQSGEPAAAAEALKEAQKQGLTPVLLQPPERKVYRQLQKLLEQAEELGARS